MTTITIDEQTRANLESIAAARGTTVQDYLKQVAKNDSIAPSREDDARQAELHRRALALADTAKSIVPMPNRPQGKSGEFADAMYAKHRR